MKNLLALVAIVLAFTVTTVSAQTTTKKERKEKAKTEQTAVTQTANPAPAAKACCASHGAKAESTATNSVKTASTTHEHAGKTCDPANCTEAQKKQCAGAKGKGCCAGSAAKAEEAPKP